MTPDPLKGAALAFVVWLSSVLALLAIGGMI